MKKMIAWWKSLVQRANVVKLPEGYKHCPECDGSGDFDEWMDCLGCDGKGYVLDD